MITTLQGVLASVSPLSAVLEVHGVGYEANIPVTTAERLPAPGSTVRLFTLVIYREDAQTLYGFASAEERDFFRMMVEHVTGIGPKMALSIMSRLSLASLRAAIQQGDVALLAKCPGIGKKTAERLVIELRGRVGGSRTTESGGTPAAESSATAAPTSAIADAVKALVALGYRANEADEAVRRAALSLGAAATTEKLIKRSLG
jgi:Holliday junction DNA helicase RuvA